MITIYPRAPHFPCVVALIMLPLQEVLYTILFNGTKQERCLLSWLNEFPTIRCWMCHFLSTVSMGCVVVRLWMSVVRCVCPMCFWWVCVCYIRVDVVTALFSGCVCVCSGTVILIKVLKHSWDKLMFLMSFSHMTCPLHASRFCSKPLHLSSSHCSFLICHFMGCPGLSELFYPVFPCHHEYNSIHESFISS